MNRKELVYNTLVELCGDNGVDAQKISSVLNISRANVSHELNNLVKEGRIYKTNGRPVLFFVSDNQISNPITSENTSKLDEFVKSNISLKQAVEQLKAAILYPPKGMNSLILGDTGVGKSMFANLMYEYAVEMGVKVKNSPFITFNCADYSNNPQLLTSQLFGVKKGTYTGAESDKIGLIEKANGGILFLDEVHRLPPEGQEALFIFLDTGSFRRMGDFETRNSDVLIISATTENPNSALLKTFTRRIPMLITIPSLKDRTLEERLFLIRTFFRNESIKLNRDIHVSLNTMRAFLSYECTNNIGQLKSDIQLVCAKAYSEFLTKIKTDVRIGSNSLPQHIKEGLYKEKEHRILWNKLVGEEIEYFKFSANAENAPFLKKEENNSIYGIIEHKLEKLKFRGISEIEIENILEKDITKYFDKYINGISDEINKKNLLNILGEDVLNLIDKVVYSIVTSLKHNISSNVYTALALHINTLISRVTAHKTIINPELNKIKKLYPKEYKIALEAKNQIEEFLHHPIPEDEAGYLTLFIVPEESNSEKGMDKVQVIIIAHGKSTATSMAEVTNELLGEKYVIGIDSPIEVKPSIILEELKKIVKENFTTSGYILLVDMGSLTTFGEIIAEEFKVPVKVFSLTSTLHVLEATRKALLGFSLDAIYRDILTVSTYLGIDSNNRTIKSDGKKYTIITTCLTGEGGSLAIKSFLNNNLKYDKDSFEILPFNSLDKNHFKDQLSKMQKEKEILFIVSSFPIETNIKQYSMYDVISMKVIPELQEIIDTKATLLRMGSILKENIINTDGEELYDDIIHVLQRIQNRLDIKLKDETLVGLILHLGFMISRLIDGDDTIDYPDKEQFIKKYISIYETIKENCLFFYNKYFVDISDNELCFLINFFIN